MTLPAAFLAQQTTNTAGTGTLTLLPAAASRRSYAAAAGSSAVTVLSRISLPGTNEYEISAGVFNGANPGTLTRVTVLANHLGTTALVNFSAGTKDVQLLYLPGQRERVSFTGNTTLTVANAGVLALFSGSTATTLTLPAAALTPANASIQVINGGTAGAVLTIDGNASETINGALTLPLLAGETVELFNSGAAWVATGLPSLALVRRQTASASATIDFVLPSGFSQFELDWFDLVPASDGAALGLRTSTDSGASFAAGGTDYNSTAFSTLPATNSMTSSNTTTSSIILGPVIDTANTAISMSGRARIYVGNGTRWANVVAQGSNLDNGTALLSMWQSGGHRANTTQINAIRLLLSAGNITNGTFSLYAVR